MKVPSQIKCDECERLKLTANKWWILNPQPFSYQVFTAESNRRRQKDAKDLCSESCLQKAEGKERERLLNGGTRAGHEDAVEVGVEVKA